MKEKDKLGRAIVIAMAFLLLGLTVMAALFALGKMNGQGKASLASYESWRYRGSKDEGGIGKSHYFAIGDRTILVLLEMEDAPSFETEREALVFLGYEESSLEERDGFCFYHAQISSEENTMDVIYAYRDSVLLTIIKVGTISTEELAFLEDEVERAKKDGALGKAECFQPVTENDAVLDVFFREE